MMPTTPIRIQQLIIGIALFVLSAGTLPLTLSAQNFPVQVQGQLIPPYSLQISDYFTDRGQDLMFSVLLRDPTVNTREVTFRIYVQHNGGDYLVSDPSFLGPSFILERGEPLLVTGDDLFPFFEQLAPVVPGLPSAYLPEGVNGICLEVIDLIRGEVISNKGCGIGFFERAQPPLVQSPVCGQEITFTETQNILFQWQPLHLASPNPITDVRYSLTLVQLDPNDDNPNDGFENSGIPIFSVDDITGSSYLYTETDPQLLDQDATYAWRVQARSFDLNGELQDFFVNGGYSQVCTFTFGDGWPPPNPLEFSSCLNSDCDYSGAIDLAQSTDFFMPGEVWQVGSFEMLLSEVQWSNGGYVGSGHIFVPFLNTYVAVNFDGVSVNNEGRLFEGRVDAEVIDPSLIPNFFSAEDLNQPLVSDNATVSNFSDEQAAGLHEFFVENEEHWVSTLALQGTPPIMPLPLGMDVGVLGETQHIVAVVALAFGPRRAEMNVVYVNQVASISSQWLKFGGRGICIRPNGIGAVAPRLELLEDIRVTPTIEGRTFPFAILASRPNEEGSYLSFNCEGFEAFQLQGRYRFNPDYIQPTDPALDSVAAIFTANTTSLIDFNARLDRVDTFEITGLPELEFSVETASFDLSLTQNPADIVFPDSYVEGQEDVLEWLGFHFEQLRMALPSEFNGNNPTEPLTISLNHLLLDTFGLSGQLLATDLMDISDNASLGGWRYFLDSASVSMDRNIIQEAYLTGGFRLPIMADDERVAFRVDCEPVYPEPGNPIPVEADFRFSLLPDTVSIRQMHASLVIDSTSVVEVERTNGAFQMPLVDMSGEFFFDLDSDDLLAYAAEDPNFGEDLTTLIDLLELAGLDIIPRLQAESIRFEHFSVNKPGTPAFTWIESLQSPDGIRVDFMGLSVQLDTINFLSNFPGSEAYMEVGLQFFLTLDVLPASPAISFTVWLKEQPNPLQGFPDYSFSRVELDFDPSQTGSLVNLPDCGLDAELPPELVDIPQTPFAGALQAGDTVSIGRFLMVLEDITGLADNTWSGSGHVDFPILGNSLGIPVSFSDLQINEDRRVYAGSAQPEVQANFQEDLQTLQTLFEDQALTGTVPDLAANLMQSLDPVAQVSDNFLRLPFEWQPDTEFAPLDSQKFVFVGLEFFPTRASVAAYLIVHLGGDNYAHFGANGLDIAPEGLVSTDLFLTLAEDFSLDGFQYGLPITFKRFEKQGNEQQGSYVQLHCQGFRQFNLAGLVEMDSTVILPVAEDRSVVTAHFSANAISLTDVLGRLDSMDQFHPRYFDEFSFEIQDAWVDLSPSRTIPAIQWPAVYTAEEAANSWLGLYVDQMQVKLPAEFNFGDDPSQRTSFASQALLVDTFGFSATLLGTTFNTPTTDGDLGAWQYSLDTVSFQFDKNVFVEAGFNGGVLLPIMEETERLPYEGTFTPVYFLSDPNDPNSPLDSVDVDIQFAVRPDTVSIKQLKSQFVFDDTSSFVVERLNGAFQTPVLDMSGTFTTDLTYDDFVELGAEFPEFNDQWQTFTGILNDLGVEAAISRFTCPSIRFDGFSVNKAGTPTYTWIDSLSFPEGMSINFMGVTASLLQVSFEAGPIIQDSIQLVFMDFEGRITGLPGLPNLPGLNLPSLPSIHLQFEFWELPDINFPRLSFRGIHFSFPELDFNLLTNIPSCADLTTEPLDLSGASQVPISSLSQGDSLQLGRFTLHLTDPPSYNAVEETWSGNGWVNIPILGPFSTVEVAYNELEINEDYIVLAGSATTQVNTNAALQDQLSQLNAQYQNGALSGTVDGLAETLWSGVESVTADNGLFRLPLPISPPATASVLDSQKMVILGLEFLPTTTSFAALLIVDLGEGDLLQFGANGLDLGPDGIISTDVRMTLAEDFSLDGFQYGVPLMFMGYEQTAQGVAGSYAELNCQGFKLFQLAGELAFDTTYMLPVDEQKDSVMAYFSATALAFDDILGGVDSMDAFYIPNFEDFEFSFAEAGMDFSTQRTIPGMQWPTSYSDEEGGSDWLGIFMPQLQLTMPSEFNFSNDPQGRATFATQNLLVDTFGISARLLSTHFLNPATDGNLGRWAYDLDSVAITFDRNVWVDGRFYGGVQLPIMAEGERLPYEGFLEPLYFPPYHGVNNIPLDSVDIDITFNVRPDTVSITPLKSFFVFDTTSLFTVGRANGAFAEPVLDLSGTFFTDLDTDDLLAIAAEDPTFGAELQSLLDLLELVGLANIVPRFYCPAIGFSGLSINKEEAPAFAWIDTLFFEDGANLDFMGLTASLTEVGFQLAEIGPRERDLGMTFHIQFDGIPGDPALIFTIWIKEMEDFAGQDVPQYSFDRIELSYDPAAFGSLVELPECDINGDIPAELIDIPESPLLSTLVQGDTVAVGRFQMIVDLIGDSASPGTWSGEGHIHIPFLGPFSKVGVAFSEIAINAERRMFDGSVQTRAQSSFQENLQGLQYQNDELTGAAPEVAGNVLAALETPAQLADNIFRLPLELQPPTGYEPIDNQKFVIIGLEFEPAATSLSALLILDLGDPDGDGNPDLIQFGAKGLDIAPEGIVSTNAFLTLAETFNLDVFDYGFPLTIKAFDRQNGVPTGSYAELYCRGFRQFNLAGFYPFSENYVVPVDPDKAQVEAHFSANAVSITDIIARVDSMDAFSLSALPEFEFSVDGAWLDFSVNRQAPGMQWNEAYSMEEQGPVWRGGFVQEMSVTMPPSFNFTDDPIQRTTFAAQNLLLDTFGISSRLLSTNFTSPTVDGRLGRWNYSLDTVYFQFDKNVWVEGGFSGGVRLPFMENTESLPYASRFNPIYYLADPNLPNSPVDSVDLDIIFEVRPDTVSVREFYSQFIFDPSSIFTVGRENGVFLEPVAQMTGDFMMEVNSIDLQDIAALDPELEAQLDAFVAVFEDVGISGIVPEFNCPSIHFENLSFNREAETGFYTWIDLLSFPSGANLNFLGLTCTLDSIRFIQGPTINDPILGIGKTAFMLVYAHVDGIPGFPNLNLPGFPSIDLPSFSLGFEWIEWPSINLNLPHFDFQTISFNFDPFDLSGLFDPPNCADLTGELPPELQVISDVPYTGELTAGTMVQVGLFQMEIIDDPQFGLPIMDASNRWSGKGKINVPFLRPIGELSVGFTSLGINTDLRVFEGSATTEFQANFSGQLQQLTGSDALDFQLAQDVFAAAENPAATLDNLFQLPLEIQTNTGLQELDDQKLIIVGLEFEARRTSLATRFLVDLAGQFLEFSGNGLNLAPDGIIGTDLTLSLAADFIPNYDGLDLPVTVRKHEITPANDTLGTFVRLNCQGFQEFKVMGDVEFPPEGLHRVDQPNVPAVAYFSGTSQAWANMIVGLDSMPDFQIAGLEDVDFHIEEGYFDLSQVRNAFSMEFPEDYPLAGDDWIGFFLEEAVLTIPAELTLSEGDERSSFSVNNLILDTLGISATALGLDLLSVGQGGIGSWNLSLDSFRIQVDTNYFTQAEMVGAVELPLLDGELDYRGTITPQYLSNNIVFQNELTVKPDELAMNLWQASINLADSSQITAQVEFDLDSIISYSAYADLYGMLAIDPIDLEALGATLELTPSTALDLYEAIMGNKMLDIPSIRVFGLKVDHPDLPTGRRFGLDSLLIGDDNVLATVAGLDVSLQSFRILESVIEEEGVSYEAVGLSLSIGNQVGNVTVRIWAKGEAYVNGIRPHSTHFTFHHIEVDAQASEFSCEGGFTPNLLGSESPGPDLYEGQTLTVGEFEMNITELTTTNAQEAEGKGLIQIPFLDKELEVRFEGLQVNSLGEVFAGEVLSERDQSVLPDALLGATQSGLPILNAGPPQLGMISQYLQSGIDLTKLPLSVKAAVESIAPEIDLPFDILLVGLVFDKDGARMQMAMNIETHTAQSLKFGATGVEIRPYGMNLGELRLFLAENLDFDDFQLPITLLGGDTASYASFDCSGFKEFQLKADYTFPDQYVKPVTVDTQSVKAHFTLRSQSLGQFVAIAEVDSFMIQGMDDVIFKIDSAYIDFSDVQNPSDFPVDYESSTTWRGVFMKKLSVTLPPGFSADGGQRISFSGNDMIYDRGNGFSGVFLAEYLVHMRGEDVTPLMQQYAAENGVSLPPVGDLGGWAYSLDTVSLSIVANSFEEFRLNGRLHLPITRQEDAIVYNATITTDASGQPIIGMELMVDGTYMVPFLSMAEMQLNDNSIAGVRFANNQVEPYCDLSGAFNIIKPEDPNTGEPEVRFQALGFQHFTLNDINSTPAFPVSESGPTGGLNNMDIAAFTFANVTFTNEQFGQQNSSGGPTVQGSSNENVGGFPIGVEGINFRAVEHEGENVYRLGFTITLNFTGSNGGSIAGRTTLGILGKPEFSNLLSEPWRAVVYEGFEIDLIEVDATIGVTHFSGGLTFIRRDPTYGRGLKGAFNLRLPYASSGFDIAAAAQFGEVNGLRYWFVDALYTNTTYGVPIGNTGLSIYGFGGGFFYNMRREVNYPDAQGAMNISPPNLSDLYTAPGVTLTGATYVPQAGTMAIKAATNIGLTGNRNTFNADAALTLQFNTSGGMDRLTFEGQGYFMSDPNNNGSAVVRTDLTLDLDFQQSLLNGTLGVYANHPMFTGANGPNGYAGTAYARFKLNDSQDWFIKIGQPGVGQGIAVNFHVVPGLAAIRTEAYLMAGYNLPSIPPLNTYHPSFNTSSFSLPERLEVTPGRSFAFGAHFSFSKYYQYLAFYATLSAGAGFDATFLQASSCNGDPNFGLNNWYMQAQAYGYLTGSIGIQITLDFFFYSKTIRCNVLDIGASIGMSAELPNPTWMRGTVGGYFSVLGGMVRGNLSFNVELGDRCTNLTFLPANPLDGIKIIGDLEIDDSADCAEDGAAVDFDCVQVYGGPKLTLRAKRNKAFEIKDIDEQGNPKTYRYRAVFDGLTIATGNEIVSGELFWDGDDAVSFRSPKIFKPFTIYTLTARAFWQRENDSGQWVRDTPDEVETFTFRTGALPDRLVGEIIEYQRPQDRQRNYYRNSSDGIIELRQEGFHYLFDTEPITEVVNGQQITYHYNYQLRLKNLTNNTEDYRDLDEYPTATNGGFIEEFYGAYSYTRTLFSVRRPRTTQEEVNRLNAQNDGWTYEARDVYEQHFYGSFFGQSVWVRTEGGGNIFRSRIAAGKTIRFSGHNEYGLMKRGHIYAMEIVGVPIIEGEEDLVETVDSVGLVTVQATTSDTLGQAGYDLSRNDVRLNAETDKDVLRRELTRVLYRFHMRNSFYPSLHEKIDEILSNDPIVDFNVNRAHLGYEGNHGWESFQRYDTTQAVNMSFPSSFEGFDYAERALLEQHPFFRLVGGAGGDIVDVIRADYVNSEAYISFMDEISDEQDIEGWSVENHNDSLIVTVWPNEGMGQSQRDLLRSYFGAFFPIGKGDEEQTLGVGYYTANHSSLTDQEIESGRAMLSNQNQESYLELTIYYYSYFAQQTPYLRMMANGLKVGRENVQQELPGLGIDGGMDQIPYIMNLVHLLYLQNSYLRGQSAMPLDGFYDYQSIYNYLGPQLQGRIYLQYLNSPNWQSNQYEYSSPMQITVPNAN